MAKDYLYKTFSYSGLLGVGVLWTTTLVAMSRANLSLLGSRPFSYLGIDPVSSRIFSSGLIVSALLFCTFGFYIRHAFNVKGNFLTFLLIGQAGQITAALAPYGTQSQLRLLHTIAAFTLAFSLPLLIRAFAYSQKESTKFKRYRWLYRLELLTFVVGMGLFIFTTGIAPLGQALPAIGYHVWIIVLTFIALRAVDNKRVR